MRFLCGGCGKQWGGLKTAHCGRCHLAFTTVKGFDVHQSIDKGEVKCKDPSTVGLVYVASRDSYRFMSPGEEADSNEVS